jgi:hypothetical protein
MFVPFALWRLATAGAFIGSAVGGIRKMDYKRCTKKRNPFEQLKG